MTTDANWCGWHIVHYNYGVSNWNLHIRRQGWASFFWNDIFSYLLALEGCTEQIVRDNSRSLFWKDNWLNGRAPMNIWPDTFLETANPNGTVKELIHWLERASFQEELEVESFLEDYNRLAGLQEEGMKWWRLSPNGLFTVKSFYTFLVDGGVRDPVSKAIWNSLCPQKVNIFNWLVWRDKILTLDNLAVIRCNKLPTTTCVLCHANCESVDHLFRHCKFVQPIWNFFLHLFGLPEPPHSMEDVWGDWWFKLRPSQ